jgi:hypothetical protein
MADDLHFSNNYRELSNQWGTGAGFQFEFYCQCCQDTWRSPFEPYRSGQASGWLREAGGFVGNLFGSLGSTIDDAAEGFARAGWGTSRDAAFKRAIGAAEARFHRCAHCHDYMCDKCWSTDTGLCVRCAPDVAAEVQQARHSGTVEAAREAARDVGIARAGQVDVGASHQLVCPECRTEAKGGKFCPQCGHALNVAANCTGCSTPLPSGSRFCPECGQGVAA